MKTKRVRWWVGPLTRLTLLGLVPACRESALKADTARVSVEGAASSGGGLAGVGQGHVFAFELELEPRAPAVGELFSVVTTVEDAQTGTRVLGADVTVDARMPQHGHGMMTAPEHRELGDGRYSSEGLKLHMPGRWIFHVRAAAERQDWLETVFEQPPIRQR